MIIETDKLHKRFGSHDAVLNLDLRVPEGSIFALLGPNGAGKTTTLKMLMNISEPTSGNAVVMGRPSRNLGPAEFQQIGYVSENQEMPDWMTVRQFLDYCRPFYPSWDEAFCNKLIESFSIPPERKLKHLSRGMKMKTALLSSLAFKPKLLVLDEPFSGLDPLAREEFVSGMLAMVGEGDWTVLVSSHDIEEVERLVDWVGFLDNGSLSLCEPVAKLQDRFRRVIARLETSPARPPALPLAGWYGLQVQFPALALVESQFSQDSLGDRVRSVYPSARDIVATSMSLREIFVALARAPKSQPAI